MLLSLVSVSTFAATEDTSKEKVMFTENFERDIDEEKWSYSNGTTDDSLHVHSTLYEGFRYRRYLFGRSVP